ncbi:unnamed protein product, partial [Ectocarpus sp. 4 AP-2014]
GDSSTSDSVHVDMAEKGGGKEAGDASSPNTGSTRLTYGQVHAALFRSQDLEALVAAFMREGELRENDERRIALKRQQFEESMAKRRSGPIAEVVKAYAAGLGYRPSTKKKHKRIVDGAGGNGGGGGSGDGTDDGDTASVETVATSLSAVSSLSSGEHPATDWWTDGGVSNRWAMGPAVRKTLFLSLQAGAVAHLPLKQRRVAELPWVEGATHILLRRPKDALVACAKYGRDFQNLTAPQVVLALRAYAAQRIQAQWRGWGPRRRFAPKILALRSLVERERAIRVARRREAFGGWKAAHRSKMELMRGTRRVFCRWRIEFERMAKTSALFRGTFWPLYVWRRWANYRISSRDKAKFLRKVYLTVILVRYFRAWNAVTETGQRLVGRADRASDTRLKTKADRLFRWWAARIRKKKFLKRQWINGGMWLRLRINTRQVATTFIVLRQEYWAFARATCARRSDAHFRSYYLLGEMDRRHTLTDKRGGRHLHCRQDNKGNNKRVRQRPGDHHSRHTTHGGSGSRSGPPAGGDNAFHNRNHGAADEDDDNASRTSLGGTPEESATEPSDSPRNESGVGVEGDQTANPQNSWGGGGRSGRRSHHNVGGGDRGGSAAAAAAAAASPPIAVLGRPNYVVFPGLRDTDFGEDVPDGGATFACEVLRDHFEKKEVLKARVNFLLYRRLGPQVLARLRIKANERQRSRYAAYVDARRVQKKYLNAWHFVVVQTAAVRRGITGEAMVMTLDQVRASMRKGSQEEEDLRRMESHPLAAGTTANFAGGAGATLGESTELGSGDLLCGVNQLDEDRKIRRRQVERTSIRSSRLVDRTVSLKEQSVQDAENTAVWVSARKVRERALAKFLTREGARARSADEKAQVFAAGFKARATATAPPPSLREFCFQYAAENLVNVVARIFYTVVDGRRSVTLRKTLRQWRSWYNLRMSVQLYNRQRLRNWLRICGRLRYLWRGMPLFRVLRVKWSVFHRLLELTNHRMLYGTPDLPAALRRRRKLLLDYSRLLQERGFVPGRYAPEVLLPATLDPSALFQRWKQHTQARAAARFLRCSLRRRHLHRVARVTFDGWRTGLGPRQVQRAAEMRAAPTQEEAGATAAQSDDAAIRVPGRSLKRTLTEDAGEIIEEEEEEEEEDSGIATRGAQTGDSRRSRRGEDGNLRQQKVSWVEARVEADLKVARRTVIAGWRSALTRTIGLRQAKREHQLKEAARRIPTFKKFLAFHTWQATERVRTEARLLVDAFLNRGHLKFQDQEPPDMVGRTNEKGSGSGLVFFRDKPVPGSNLVCEVRVMTRVGEGVVGIQLVMTAGKRTTELPVHGAAVGENRSTRAHCFAVDAPVERLSRFECEHNDGLIERMRVVTSGGRWSPWFGERLTAIPYTAVLPDWHVHSLAATTAQAATSATRAATAASVASLDEVSSTEKAATALAAAEAQTTAANAPEWDVQKEYITGLVGVRTQERLVGLGVITRHVTNSHVFSYLWEAPDEDEGAMHDKNSESSLDGRLSISDKTASDTSRASNSLTSIDSSTTGEPRTSSMNLSQARPPPSTLVGGVAPASGISNGTEAGDDGDATGNRSHISPASSGGSTLSRVEAKQLKFAQEMQDREKLREGRARLAKEREEDMERLMRGGKPNEDEDEEEGDEDPSSLSSPGISATGKKRRKRGRAPPAAHEEFSCILRMRRTDARFALERSVALARRARTYTSNSIININDASGALSTLTVTVGLTNWLHSALLPQLVPLPMLATTTTDMFDRGEKMLMTAGITKARGNRMKNAAESMKIAKQKRGRMGVMSPRQRAQEIRDREHIVEWEAKSAALLAKAHRQRVEADRLLDDARDRLPKVSQSVKTLRMYLEYLKLARRQMELEREFGLGALRTKKPAESAVGGQLNESTSCGIEESLFDATIKSLQHERQDDDAEGGATTRAGGGVGGVSGAGPSTQPSALTEEGASVGPELSGLGTIVSSVNPWS